MPKDRLEKLLAEELNDLKLSGAAKGGEEIIAGIIPAAGKFGPRYLLQGEGDAGFLRMNSNGYLGMALRTEVIEAEERAVRAFGAGPGAVRFISGTWAPHVELEGRLAEFHTRPRGQTSALIFSSAYAAVMGVLPPLVTKETSVISDALNHNSIINALKLSAPKEKRVYGHLDLGELEECLRQAAANCRRAIVVTDGVFSMRGDHAPLKEIFGIARSFDAEFQENVVLVVDDSHGVGAFGKTGRGTEEVTGTKADILIGTLGKAFGVNGGYAVAAPAIVDYLREKSPFYVYSNPITPAEAAAAKAALDVVDSRDGRALLAYLARMTERFDAGLAALGFETIAGRHPVVPLMIRNTNRTATLVRHLRDHHVLATGLNFPVVPKGDEEIRFQISADHTEADIDYALGVLKQFKG